MSKRKFYQKKRVMIPLTIASSLIFLGIFGALHSSMYQTTANAYVDEYLIQITPKISSKVIELNLNNNSNVKKGEIIAELDGSKYSLEIKNLEKKFLEIQKELKSFDDEINKTNFETNATKNSMEKAKTNLENANNDYIRYKNEFKDGTVTKKDLNNAIKNLELAQEQYEQAQSNLKNTSKNLNEIISKKDSQIDKAREILETLENKKLELSNATIISPKNGKITNLNTKVGDFVTNDKVLFSILPDECFIIANFKKAHNANIKIGQKATIKIYSAGFAKFSGEIVEILPEKANYISTKIKINDNVEKYNLKTGAKAIVKLKLK
ncbi:MAG: HlyD family secretion protein [Candidatus Gastranaerophilales bacterium]|nr:HlyD family secretion protein [Candidatus Gastranaerophilales bacterium]